MILISLMSDLIEVICEACKLQCFKTPKYYRSALKKGTKTFYHGECYKTARKREKYSYKPKIEVMCDHCSITFKKYQSKIDITTHNFCSRKCTSLFTSKPRIDRIELTCPTCSLKPSTFRTRTKQSNSTLFCSKKCYFGYAKTIQKPKKFVTRSKLEIFIEQEIKTYFPNLEVIFNAKFCHYELDIYIPSLNHAIEINGITHYEPIYGLQPFFKTRNRDILKKSICEDHNVLLDIVSVLESTKSNSNREKYWKIIRNLIESRIQSYKFLPSDGFEFHEIQISKKCTKLELNQ